MLLAAYNCFNLSGSLAAAQSSSQEIAAGRAFGTSASMVCVEKELEIGDVLYHNQRSVPFVASLGIRHAGRAVERVPEVDGVPSADDGDGARGSRGGQEETGGAVAAVSASILLGLVVDDGESGEADSCGDIICDDPQRTDHILHCRGKNGAEHVPGHEGLSVTVSGSSFGPGYPTQPGAQNPWVFTPPVASSPPGAASPIREGSR